LEDCDQRSLERRVAFVVGKKRQQITVTECLLFIIY
jgi:hypothetical protein